MLLFCNNLLTKFTTWPLKVHSGLGYVFPAAREITSWEDFLCSRDFTCLISLNSHKQPKRWVIPHPFCKWANGMAEGSDLHSGLSSGQSWKHCHFSSMSSCRARGPDQRLLTHSPVLTSALVHQFLCGIWMDWVPKAWNTVRGVSQMCEVCLWGGGRRSRRLS